MYRAITHYAGSQWRIPVVFLLALSLLAFAGCGDDDDGESTPARSATTGATAPQTAPSTEAPLEGKINVFAASSLTEVFKALAESFTEEHPDTSVNLNFAASSALATQIKEGGPADVFASADNTNMTVIADAGLAESPEIFARNSPVVVVPADNTTIMTFEDLASPDIRLVLAGANVPIGRYAREILANASAADGGISADFSERVLANLRSEEANVRAVLSKVQLGEADAGVVYVTDIGAAKDDVRQVEIPTQYNVVAQYPITAIKDSEEGDVAAAFVEFVLSDAGQEILAGYGFLAP